MKLTKTQELFYHIDRFTGGRAVGLCALSLYPEHIGTEEVNRCLNELYLCNDIMRIRIFDNNGVPEQECEPFIRKDYPVLHFEDKAALDFYAQQFAKEPMNIFGELCRIIIVTIPGAVGLLGKLHHCIIDAWGFSVLREQFSSLLQGNTPEAYSYFDHLEAEDAYRAGNRYPRDYAYYESVCRAQRNSDPFAKVCSDISADRFQAYFSKEMTGQIKEYANLHSISPAAVLLAGIGVCLSSLQDCTSMCVGMPFLNRSGHSERNTVGSFINTVPLTLRIRFNQSFESYTVSTAESCLAAMRHQRFNIAMLQDSAELRNQPYDVIFSFQAEKSENPGSYAEWYPCGAQLERLQIHVDDRNLENAFHICYDYQNTAFSREEISALQGRLERCLITVLSDDQITVGSIDLLSNSEANLLESLNRTDYPLPETQTIYGLFSEQAQRIPDKCCIMNDGIRFGGFERQCAALDRQIRQYTGGKKQCIALISDRNSLMYLAMYGILRGGNAYLPIQPDHPKDRIRFMLEDSKSALVIGQSQYREFACGLPFISLEEFLEKGAVRDVLPSPAAEPEDIAYVIYTSGSTGKPKGVSIRNAAVVNRLLWMQRKYPLGPKSVILSKTPYTFDVSVWENFWWGVSGGSLAYCAQGEHFMPDKILDAAEKYQVTHLHFVPSVFDRFLEHVEADPGLARKMRTVRHVFLSGEALRASAAVRFYSLFPNASLHNLYGPTECTVDVTYYDCSPDEVDPVPIGRPIDNTKIYILDSHLRQVAPGVRGELCVSGICVGAGYLNRPVLTEDRFLPNPFGPGVLYRTGDCAYINEQGQIIFCGRKDGQVKLHGQRIELGEITRVISEVHGVDAAEVLLLEINDKQRLCSFYTGTELDPSMLRTACLNKLPAYMVPALMLHLPAMPLNENGKLDHKKLIEFAEAVPEVTAVNPPINDTERMICDAFRRILPEAEIGRTTNFFFAGGSSLDVITLLSSDKALKQISTADFIRDPTPAGVAVLLQTDGLPEAGHLSLLIPSKQAKKTLIILPYAGGDASAFADLAATLNKRQPELEVWYLDYLHSEVECLDAAAKLAGLAKKSELYFYAHCVGNVLAFRLSDILYREYGVQIRRLFAAAYLPKPYGGQNPWRFIPRCCLRLVLTAAGSHLRLLSKTLADQYLNSFLEDTDFAFQILSEALKRTNTPVSVLLCRHDIFTLNYRKAGLLWYQYSDQVSLNYIPGHSHYFQSDNASGVSDWILSCI